MCKLCGCALPDPSPPKRPRRIRAASPAGHDGCGNTLHVHDLPPSHCQDHSTPPVIALSNAASSETVSRTSQTPTPAQGGQFRRSSSTHANAGSSTACSNLSNEFAFVSPVSVRCSDPTTAQSTLSRTSSTVAPSAWTFGGQSRNYNEGCAATMTAGMSQEPSVSTVKAPSAPVFGSLRADREERTNSAPPSVFPLTYQPSVTRGSSSNETCTSTSYSPSSTASNQLFGSSCTSNTQASSSTFCLSKFSSTSVSTSSGSVPSNSNRFSCSTLTTTQSDTAFEAQPFGSTSSDLLLPGGAPSNTSGSCTTASFFPVFGSPTTGSSTQSFGSPTLASNCSDFPFRFGTGSTNGTNMDTSPPSATLASTSANSQSPSTTCWRWNSSDTLSQTPSTLAPSTRISPFRFSTTSRTESDVRFGSTSPSTTTPSVFQFGENCTKSQTGVDASQPGSQTSVSWASQNTVMSTTISQTASRSTSPFTSYGMALSSTSSPREEIRNGRDVRVC